MWFVSGWVGNYMSQFVRIAESKTTTMGHIKREHLKEALTVIPDKKTIEKCNNIFNSLREKSNFCLIENNTLKKLKNALLPRIISGELIIPNTKTIIKEEYI